MRFTCVELYYVPSGNINLPIKVRVFVACRALRTEQELVVIINEEVSVMKTKNWMLHKLTAGWLLWTTILMLGAALLLVPREAVSATRAEINRDVNIALDTLYRTSPAARKISKIAKGVLVFPSIIKGSLIFGGEYGEGALRVNRKTVGYYNTIAASYGLEVGAQSYGYALFFLDQDSLDYLKKTDGWELGTTPNFVVMNEGMARNLTTTTAHSGVYAFVFNQKGLMAGISIEGSKITRIHPK